MMTPKEFAEDVINQFDMIIYTDQDHYRQVIQCAKKAIELQILTLERIDCDDSELDYFKNVLTEIKSTRTPYT